MSFLNSRRILAASLAALFAGALLPAAEAAEPQVAHAVFFTLNDRSPRSREAFVATCEKYLSGHKGGVSFSVGTIAEDIQEPGISDREFDVAVHVVFEDKAMLAAYHKSGRHDQFVAAIKGKVAKVRVFDSYLSGAGATSAAK